MTALVYGDSIRSTSGVASIRKNMGVCPQVHNPLEIHFLNVHSNCSFPTSLVALDLLYRIREILSLGRFYSYTVFFDSLMCCGKH